MPSAAEGREARLARAGEIADLIESKNYQEAANLIRPAGTLSSGSDYLPEAIGRFMDDRRISDRGSLIALVEAVIMGHYPKTVIPDMESLGYKVNEQALNMASTGCHAYAKAIQADRLGKKYCIHSCPCCRSKDGKAFPLKKARIGRTLPPFSKSCAAWVSFE